MRRIQDIHDFVKKYWFCEKRIFVAHFDLEKHIYGWKSLKSVGIHVFGKFQTNRSNILKIMGQKWQILVDFTLYLIGDGPEKQKFKNPITLERKKIFSFRKKCWNRSKKFFQIRSTFFFEPGPPYRLKIICFII